MSSFNRIDTTANRIKSAMESAGMRQADLARKAEIDKGALSHYLKGRYEPKQDIINRLAIALGVSEMWLWGYDCKKERPETAVVKPEIEIKKNPSATAERHFEILMDEDFISMFDEFHSLDAKKRKIVKDLVHSLADAEA